MKTMTREIGSAAAIDAVCRALSPPARSSAAATRPSPIPQTTRKRCGGWSSPIDSMVVITSVPESDEVMNHVTSRKVASADMIHCRAEMSVRRSMVP